MGLDLQTEASKLQKEVLGGFRMRGLPTVVVNRNPGDELSLLAFLNFKGAVCRVLKETADTNWNQDLTQYCTPKVG